MPRSPSTQACSSSGGSVSSSNSPTRETMPSSARLPGDVAAQAVGLDRLEQRAVGARLGVDPDPVRPAQDPHVEPHLPLVVEKGGVAPLAGLERLDVIRHLALEELRGLGAPQADASARAAIDDHVRSVDLGASKPDVVATKLSLPAAARRGRPARGQGDRRRARPQRARRRPGRAPGGRGSGGPFGERVRPPVDPAGLRRGRRARAGARVGAGGRGEGDRGRARA